MGSKDGESLISSASFGFDDVDVVSKSRPYDEFFKLDYYQLKHPLYKGGQSSLVKRELLERGDAVVVLPYDVNTDEVVLIEQFRIGAYGAGCRDKDNDIEPSSPWLIECIAGMVDKNRTPAEVAYAEAQEEAGIALAHLTQIMQLYASPGGMSERVYYYVAITDSKGAGGIHGLDSESEDIRVMKVPFSEALQWLHEGKINNASTVIALQWLQLHKHSYLQQIGL